MNHFTLYNKLTEDAALLSDQVQVNLKLISNIKEKIATNNAVILEQVEVVSQLEIKLADLRISLHMVLERANQLANLIYIMTGVHSKLQAEKEDIDISKLKLDAEQGRIEYEALQEQLIDLAPQDKKSILKAHEALFENNNIFNCQDALREIHP